MRGARREGSPTVRLLGQPAHGFLWFSSISAVLLAPGSSWLLGPGPWLLLAPPARGRWEDGLPARLPTRGRWEDGLPASLPTWGRWEDGLPARLPTRCPVRSRRGLSLVQGPCFSLVSPDFKMR